MKNLSILGLSVLIFTSCIDPLAKPAKPEQLESFKKVLEMYPEVLIDYQQAESDGVVTKGELMEIIKKLELIKSERDSKQL